MITDKIHIYLSKINEIETKIQNNNKTAITEARKLLLCIEKETKILRKQLLEQRKAIPKKKIPQNKNNFDGFNKKESNFDEHFNF